MPDHRLPALAVALLALLLIPSPARAAGPVVSIEAPLLSLARPGSWTTVQVEVRTEGKPFSGTVEVLLNDSVIAVRTIEAAARSSRRLAVPTLVPGWFRTLDVRVWQGRSVLYEQSFENNNFGETSDLHLLAIGEDPLGLTTLRDATGTPVVGHDGCVERRGVRAETLLPESLPAFDAGWSPVDVAIWRQPDPARLSPEQQAALRSWLHSGGVLVVSLSDGWRSWTSSSLGELSGVAPSRAEPSVETLRAVLSLAAQEAPEDAAPLPFLELDRRGATMASEAVGAGRLVTLGFDLEAGELRPLLNRERFWRALLGVARPGAPPLMPAVPMPFLEPSACDEDRWTFGERSEGSARTRISEALERGLGSFARANPLPLGPVLLFGLLYLLLIGPGDYQLSRRLGRPMLTWLTFPAIAVAFSVFAALVITSKKQGADELRCAETLDLFPETGAARGSSWCSLWSAGRQELVVPVPRGTGQVVASGEEGGSRDITDPSRLDLRFQANQWSVNSWRASWAEPWQGSVTLFERPNGDLALTNHSGVAFQEAALVLGGRLYLLGALPDGAEAALPEPEPIQRDALLSRWLPLTASATPSPADSVDSVEIDNLSGPSPLESLLDAWPVTGGRLPPLDAVEEPTLLGLSALHSPALPVDGPAPQGFALVRVSMPLPSSLEQP